VKEVIWRGKRDPHTFQFFVPHLPHRSCFALAARRPDSVTRSRAVLGDQRTLRAAILGATHAPTLNPLSPELVPLHLGAPMYTAQPYGAGGAPQPYGGMQQPYGGAPQQYGGMQQPYGAGVPQAGPAPVQAMPPAPGTGLSMDEGPACPQCCSCCGGLRRTFLSFSWPSRVFIGVLLALVSILMVAQPANLIVVPVTMLPPVSPFPLRVCVLECVRKRGTIFGAPLLTRAPSPPLSPPPPQALLIYFVYVRRLRLDGTHDETFVRMFAAGAIPGALVAMLIEMLLSVVFALICFGSDINGYLAQIAEQEAEGAGGDSDAVPPSFQLSHGFSYVAFLLLTSFITAALVEESVKAALVRHTCCGCDPAAACCLQRPDPRPRHQAYATIAFLLATSIGFSTTENLAYVLSGNAAEDVGSDLLGRLLLALVRSVVSLPVHAICASFTGLRLSIRDVQRRQRDAVVLAHLSAAGTPGFVVLPSGVSVQLANLLGGGGGGTGPGPIAHPPPMAVPVAANVADWGQAVPVARPVGAGGAGAAYPSPAYAAPYAAPAAVPLAQQQQQQLTYASMPTRPASSAAAAGPTAALGIGVPGSAAAGAAATAARQVNVWSWPRVLWPAVLVHGSFDFFLMLFGDGVTIPNIGGAITAVVFTGLIVMVVSLWAVVSQFKAAFAIVALGRVPERVTCAPVWWPAWARRLFGLGAAGPAYETVDGAPTTGNGEGDGDGDRGAGHAMLGAGRGGGGGGGEDEDQAAPEGIRIVDPSARATQNTAAGYPR
jgi:RsiW-degrading membrane proteinase PrsW (M82 family)